MSISHVTVSPSALGQPLDADALRQEVIDGPRDKYVPKLFDLESFYQLIPYRRNANTAGERVNIRFNIPPELARIADEIIGRMSSNGDTTYKTKSDIALDAFMRWLHFLVRNFHNNDTINVNANAELQLAREYALFEAAQNVTQALNKTALTMRGYLDLGFPTEALRILKQTLDLVDNTYDKSRPFWYLLWATHIANDEELALQISRIQRSQIVPLHNVTLRRYTRYFSEYNGMTIVDEYDGHDDTLPITGKR